MKMSNERQAMKKRLLHVLFLVTSLQPLRVSAEDFSVFADLLYWKASQQTSSTFATTVKDSGKVLDLEATNIDFGWKPGFRGGFLYNLDCDCWDTGLSWTYFPAKTSTQFFTPDQIVIPEFFSGFLSNNFFFGAKVDWKLALNMIDVEVGRTIDIDDSFAIRPSIGLKGGTIHQTIDCQWNAGFYTATEKVKNNFSGVGPSLGVDIKWNIISHLNLIGDFSTAFLWGNWKISDTYSRPSALFGLVTPTTITTSLNNSKLGTVMYKYRLGFEWIFEGRFPLTLQVGYEMQFWPNQLRMPTFQQLPVHGDLTLQGGTCQIRIDL